MWQKMSKESGPSYPNGHIVRNEVREKTKALLKEKGLGNAYKLNYARRQIILKAERHGFAINAHTIHVISK